MRSEILQVTSLTKWFSTRTGLRTSHVRAVDGISFDILRREAFGLVGESGCGKSTTARLVLRLIDKTAGTVLFKGENVFALKSETLRRLRCKMQMIFQNPYESLESRLSVSNLLSEPLKAHNMCGSNSDRVARVKEVLQNVELTPPENFMSKHPRELSGGQLQRLAIARALVLQPELIVADEPVSMLDVSIRAYVLKLLLRLRDEMGLTFLFITHDLAISKFVCDRLGVMYLGKIVEMGPSGKVLDEPLHPYTKALRAAVPTVDLGTKERNEVSNLIGGEIPKATDIPSGCRFHPRCPRAMSFCKNLEPHLLETEHGRYVACHLYSDSNLEVVHS